jgi:hypothetical protein
LVIFVKVNKSCLFIYSNLGFTPPLRAFGSILALGATFVAGMSPRALGATIGAVIVAFVAADVGDDLRDVFSTVQNAIIASCAGLLVIVTARRTDVIDRKLFLANRYWESVC